MNQTDRQRWVDADQGRVTMNLNKTDPMRPCRNCGLQAHEHDRLRWYLDNGTYTFRYACPEDAL